MKEINPDSKIDEILDHWPQLTRIFLKYRMGCPGCYLSTFEFLSDALDIYHLPVEPFINKLTKAIENIEE